MSDTSALLFVLTALFIFFVYMRFKTRLKVFNLISIGVVVAMVITQWTSNAVMISISVCIIVWLLIDLFRDGDYI